MQQVWCWWGVEGMGWGNKNMGGESTPLGGVGGRTRDIGSINTGKISFVLQPPYSAIQWFVNSRGNPSHLWERFGGRRKSQVCPGGWRGSCYCDTRFMVGGRKINECQYGLRVTAHDDPGSGWRRDRNRMTAAKSGSTQLGDQSLPIHLWCVRLIEWWWRRGEFKGKI